MSFDLGSARQGDDQRAAVDPAEGLACADLCDAELHRALAVAAEFGLGGGDLTHAEGGACAVQQGAADGVELSGGHAGVHRFCHGVHGVGDDAADDPEVVEVVCVGDGSGVAIWAVGSP